MVDFSIIDHDERYCFTPNTPVAKEYAETYFKYADRFGDGYLLELKFSVDVLNSLVANDITFRLHERN